MKYLVGTDAEGIQLRILAHYLRNDDYVTAITEGNKHDETDIHNVNLRSLELQHLVRDDSKKFIYAFILGAGIPKLASILRCNQNVASTTKTRFIDRTDGLGELREGKIRRDAARGYFVGLDGRRVPQSSAHLMLAGYLQNGESVVMKHANIRWREWADKASIHYQQINDVHDEWVTEVYTKDEAEEIGALQCKSLEVIGEELGVYCPLAGETKVGRNWLEIHGGDLKLP